MRTHTTLRSIIARCRAASRDQQGQGLAEYGLLISIISIASIFLLMFLGSTVTAFLNTIATTL